MFLQGLVTDHIISPTQYRTESGDVMQSERMLMPKWAKVAATRLSDEQIAFEQISRSTSGAADSTLPYGSRGDVLPPEIIVEGGETVGGTVSRKGKFGFVCEKCYFVPKKSSKPDWQTWTIGWQNRKSVGLHFPARCNKCRARMKRWTCAARNYDRLELLRMLEGRHCLRFITFTKNEWNVKVSLERDLWEQAESIKKQATRQFRNWRTRNKYWLTREAKGQAYYECTMKPVWNGWGFDEIQLHFHIHTVVCSKRIENKDIQINLDTLLPIPMSTTIQREWGGVVDVRACKTWKHGDGAVKTSKRFVMNYLVDYINKSPHWQSTKFGDWSS